MPPVIVVGGGIAGLATAYELHRLGVPFTLLEGAARAGGVILSERIDGFTIDAGPDALLVQKPDGVRLCEELGLGNRLVSTRPPRLAFVQRAGRLHPLPAGSVLGIPTRVGPFIRTRLFSWPGKLRMAAEVVIPRRRDDGDESIGSFIARRFGREAVEYLAEPLLAGIHAGDVDRLSMRALFPRFVEAERARGSLLRTFRRAAGAAAGQDDTVRPGLPPHEGAFLSLPGGLTEMTCALVAALPPGSIRLGARVCRVSALAESAGAAVAARAAAFRIEAGAGGPIEASALVLATPAYVTAQLVRAIDADLARLCSEISYASTATIALAFDRAAVRHPLNGSGFVVPRSEGTGILAASWLSSKWPDRAPEGRVLLRAFVGGARDPHGLERSDSGLVDLAMGALRPVLGIEGNPLLTRVYRWESANAQHEVGHLDRLAAIDRSLTAQPGLFFTGSGFRAVGIPACVADGRATARKVAEWLSAPRG
jgi:oxygen-dependent protoporphyrinogen oxidase